MGDPPPTIVAHAFGSLSAFEPETENISTYLERVHLYFDANDIGAAKKTSVLLTVIGPKNYSIIRSLVAPALPKDKTFEELVTTLKTHFQPKPLLIAERFRFYQRSQAAGETVQDFVADLRRLAITCEFGDFLNEALRDRFVCGLKTEAVQKKLLTEDKLTIARAVELARGMEVAAAESKELKVPSGQASSGKIFLASPQKPAPSAAICLSCGKADHARRDCRYRMVTCHNCGKVGHLAAICRRGTSSEQSYRFKGQQRRPGRAHQIMMEQPSHTEDTLSEEAVQEEENNYRLYTLSVNQARVKPILVDLQVLGRKVSFEIDTGAAVSIMSEEIFKRKFSDCKLKACVMELQTYTGQPLSIKGSFSVDVQYKSQNYSNLDLVIVTGNGPCLLGRDWLQKIRLDWPSISVVKKRQDSLVCELLSKYSSVFASDLGTMRHFQATVEVGKDAKPRFHRARPVPFALKSAVDEELNRLERDGVMEKIPHSLWAAPIVTVPKKDGSVRICGDYKVTVNPVLQGDQYPLPRAEDIFATLAGGKSFTTLDLSHAYNQISLEQDSQKYAVINTPRGLYQYNRLPFGIASAPSQFQRIMDQILQGMKHVTCYIDDVSITGETEEEHLANLEEVLRRFQEHNVRVKREKCRFMCDSVEYLGHKIDAGGIHATDAKLAAISQAPEPKNVQQLRAFLGLVNYYAKFIPNRSTLAQPLNSLLCKNTPWKWTKKHSDTFSKMKRSLMSSHVLIHYSSSLPLRLAGDASAYGIGAVISHVTRDGTERPIAFASRALSESEKNYSQIEKEALSLVYGVKKFHQYLYGRTFTLVTDHKPLTTILGPKNGVPPLAAARLQRWALILAAYSYAIEYRSTDHHSNADGLSRLPVEAADGDFTSNIPALFNLQQLDKLPVSAKQVQAATRNDPILSKVIRFAREGWPAKCGDEFQPYWSRRFEITVEGGCLLWGIRVIAPPKLQTQLLDELHRDHPGISRMKSVARSYFWWPGVDKSIENVVRSCNACQAVKHSPPVAPLQPWLWPAKPWKRIHLDFAGPFQGAMFLVAVDAHSKWPEVHIMKETTAAKTIGVLRWIFSRFGLPEQLVSDNGPQFISDDFAKFMKLNGVKHVRCTPYHPATNGLAERFVQSLKLALKASVNSGLSLEHRLLNFLFSYRSTPHATTGVSPASLFLHREIRTRLDMLHPSNHSNVLAKQSVQKEHHDKRAQDRNFFVGQNVMARNLRPGSDWVPAVIVERLGPVSYLVETSDQLLWRRHIDLLRKLCVRDRLHQSGNLSPDEHEGSTVGLNVEAPIPVPADATTLPDSGLVSNSSATAESVHASPQVQDSHQLVEPTLESTTDTNGSPIGREYPSRQRQPPDRFIPG